jgi:hypothetical protein
MVRMRRATFQAEVGGALDSRRSMITKEIGHVEAISMLFVAGMVNAAAFETVDVTNSRVSPAKAAGHGLEG